MTTVVCVRLYSVGFSYRGLAPWTCALCFEVDRRTGCRYRRTGSRYRRPVDRPPGDRCRSTRPPPRLPVGWVAGEGGVAAGSPPTGSRVTVEWPPVPATGPTWPPAGSGPVAGTGRPVAGTVSTGRRYWPTGRR